MDMIILVIILFPIIHVLVSSRSHGGAKLGWFLAILFLSWVAYIPFLIFTQNELDKKEIEQ